MKNVAVMVVVTFLLLLPDFHGWFSGLEGRAFDLYMWLLSDNQPARSRILIIDVDDESYRDCFDNRSPLDEANVVSLVNFAVANGAKVVAVDLLTESKEYKCLTVDSSPGNSIVWAATIKPYLQQEVSFADWLVGGGMQSMSPDKALGHEISVHSPFRWAVPAYPRDEDLRIRRLPRYFSWKDHTGRVVSTLSRRTAMEYSLLAHRSFANDAEEVMVTLKGGPLDRISAKQVLGCTARAEKMPSRFPELFRDIRISDAGSVKLDDNIVVIGGTFEESKDFHETPFGERPGVVINAHAIHAELSGYYVQDPSKFKLFLSDVVIGSLFAFGVWWFHPRKTRTLIWMTIVAAVLLYILAGILLYSANILWLSWTGALIGSLVGFIVQMWDENPDLPVS